METRKSVSVVIQKIMYNLFFMRKVKMLNNLKNNRMLTYDECFWFHRVANAKERESRLFVYSHKTQSVRNLGWGIRWAHNLLSLAFTS